MSQGVRFVRIGGRIVPIKSDKAPISHNSRVYPTPGKPMPKPKEVASIFTSEELKKAAKNNTYVKRTWKIGVEKPKPTLKKKLADFNKKGLDAIKNRLPKNNMGAINKNKLYQNTLKAIPKASKFVVLGSAIGGVGYAIGRNADKDK